MAIDVNIPDIDFTGFYYAEILDNLLVWMRREVPEISTQSPYDPAVQMLRAYAFVGHLNNTLLDVVANEGTLPTARLRESVVRLLALLGYIPHADIPARATLRSRLVSSFSTTTLVVTKGALFATRRESDTPPILFESEADVSVTRTDIVGNVYFYDASADTWTEHTTDVNNPGTTFGFNFAPGDALYVAHDDVMTDRVDFTGLVASQDFGDDRVGSPLIMVLERCDGEIEEGQPDSVTVDGAVLRVVVDSLLGDPGESRAGLSVRVGYIANRTSEWATVKWDGENYVEVSFLGQTVPSVLSRDYVVGTYWHEVEGVVDNTRAVRVVTAEVIGTGDGVATNFVGTLARYPLHKPERSTDDFATVTFNYTDTTATARVGTLNVVSGATSGDIASATVNVETGAFNVTTSFAVANATDITCTYSRAKQPFQQDGDVNFPVPFNANGNWDAMRLDAILRDNWGTPPSKAGYWLRWRCVSLGDTPDVVNTELDRILWDKGGLYIKFDVVQGRTWTEETVGSGTAEPSQTYTLANTPVIEGSVEVFVDGEAWTQVDDFASSDSTDKHYTVRIDSDGVATIQCGDGTAGRVFTAGVNNILATYRTGAEEDGNVGSGKIEVNRSGMSRIKATTNPSAARGWLPQEGSVDEAALERMKRDGVASLRVLERAVSRGDWAHLAVRWRDAEDGNGRPFVRAHDIPGAFGPGTVRLIVVPVGSETGTPSAQLDRLELYFNGNLDDGGSVEGVTAVNTEVTVEEYVPWSTTIRVLVSGNRISEDTLAAGLHASLQPESLLLDGSGYRWRFGPNITQDRIRAILREQDPTIENIIVQLPATDQQLAPNQLPKLSLAQIEVVPV